MIVQPKRASLAAGPDTIKLMPSAPGDLALECVVTGPTSAAGRTVYLHVPADQVPALLKVARWAAVKVRSQPLAREDA
jgi:hypothetical protein